MTSFEYFKLPDNIAFSQSQIEEIWNMRPENPHEIKIYGKLIKTPRLQKAYGKDYKFSGTTSISDPMPPQIFDNLIEFLNNKYNSKFNMLLINWYRNGEDYIGYHADDERQIIPNSSILTVSLGVTRDFILKNKETKEKIIYDLESNSVLAMHGTCQKTHKHSVPKRIRVKDYRISITLRQFIE